MALSGRSMDEANIKDLLKYIGDNYGLLTFGYFRKNATMIGKMTPDPVINICLIYAFLIIEYFKDTVMEYGQITGDDKRTAINLSCQPAGIFGAFIVDCNDKNTDIYSWKIKINSVCTQGNEISIGIDEWYESRKLKALYSWDSNHYHYAYAHDAHIFIDTFSFSDSNSILLVPSQYRFSRDDIITMVVNTAKNTVDFFKNDHHVYQCKEIKNCKYRLGIYLGEIYNEKNPMSVTLQEFSISFQK